VRSIRNFSHKKAQKAQKKKTQHGPRSFWLGLAVKYVFLDLKLWPSEVDQKTMFDPRSSKIAKQLRDMFVNQDFTSLEFYDQSTGDEQICTEVAQQSSVCIENIQRVLLGNFDSDLR